MLRVARSGSVYECVDEHDRLSVDGIAAAAVRLSGSPSMTTYFGASRGRALRASPAATSGGVEGKGCYGNLGVDDEVADIAVDGARRTMTTVIAMPAVRRLVWLLSQSKEMPPPDGGEGHYRRDHQDGAQGAGGRTWLLRRQAASSG